MPAIGYANEYVIEEIIYYYGSSSKIELEIYENLHASTVLFTVKFRHGEYGSTTIDITRNHYEENEGVMLFADGIYTVNQIIGGAWDSSAYYELDNEVSPTYQLVGNANEYMVEYIGGTSYKFVHAEYGETVLSLRLGGPRIDPETVAFDDSVYNWGDLRHALNNDLWDSSAYGDNRAPTLGALALSDVTEDIAYTINASDIITAASDLDGDAISLTSLSISTGGGTLIDNGDDTWTYTPAADDDTEVTFSYTVSDGTDIASGSTTVDILPVDDRTNLTDSMVNVSASVSSVWNNDDASNGADRVLDGDVGTINHTHKEGRSDTWLEVDLGEDAYIEMIEIANRQDSWSSRSDGATIQVLDDDAVVWSSTMSGDWAQDFATAGVVGDTVRIENDDHIHIAEIDVFGQEITPEVNLTDVMDATATQSSNYSSTSYMAGSVLDGDNATFNHTAAAHGGTEWLMIDLGADAYIDAIDIHNREGPNWLMNRFSGATVDVLNDGEVVWSSGSLNGSADQTVGVDGIVGDAVRINQGQHHLHLAEVDVYGSLFV